MCTFDVFSRITLKFACGDICMHLNRITNHIFAPKCQVVKFNIAFGPFLRPKNISAVFLFDQIHVSVLNENR